MKTFVLSNISHFNYIDKELKLQVDQFRKEVEDVKIENERYKEKVQELEKWIVMLLNNFYQGNPQALESIQRGLQSIDDLRNDKFQLKKIILLERKKNNDLQDAYIDLKRKVKEREEDFRKSDIGELVLQKQALEENLRLLSEEVETLSTKNERLLNDLKRQDFYQAYNNAVEELSQLKQAHAALISTMKLDKKHQYKSIKDPRKLIPIGGQVTDASFSFENRNQIQSLNPDESGKSMQNIFNFLSCQGCGGGSQMPGNNNQLIFGGSMLNQMQDKQSASVREEYEAVMGQQEISFLNVKPPLIEPQNVMSGQRGGNLKNVSPNAMANKGYIQRVNGKQNIKAQALKKLSKSPMIQSKRIFKPFQKSGTPFFVLAEQNDTKFTISKRLKFKNRKLSEVMDDVCENLQTTKNGFFHPQQSMNYGGKIDCSYKDNLYNSDEEVHRNFKMPSLAILPVNRSMFHISDSEMDSSFDGVSQISSPSNNTNEISFDDELFQQCKNTGANLNQNQYSEGSQQDNSTHQSSSILDFMTNYIEGKECVEFNFKIDESFENELIRALT